MAACVALLASAAVSVAHTAGAGFAVPRQTIDAGAGRAAGATFTLTGTLGQPDAGVASSARYTLRGGFHRPGAAERPPEIFADGFEAPPTAAPPPG